MTPEEIGAQRAQLALIKDIKDMILSDARALYSLRGCTSHKSTFDVLTSSTDTRYQATLIVYPDLTTDTRWTALYDGVMCKDIPTALMALWTAIQTGLGDTKTAQQSQAAFAHMLQHPNQPMNGQVVPTAPVGIVGPECTYGGAVQEAQMPVEQEHNGDMMKPGQP